MRGPGVGVFETMRVRRGAIPLLSRHLARLGRSLSALGLPAADRDLDTFVVPFTEMDEAVLRLDVREGRAAVTVGGVPGGWRPGVGGARRWRVAVCSWPARCGGWCRWRGSTARRCRWSRGRPRLLEPFGLIRFPRH